MVLLFWEYKGVGYCFLENNRGEGGTPLGSTRGWVTFFLENNRGEGGTPLGSIRGRGVGGCVFGGREDGSGGNSFQENKPRHPCPSGAVSNCVEFSSL